MKKNVSSLNLHLLALASASLGTLCLADTSLHNFAPKQGDSFVQLSAHTDAPVPYATATGWLTEQEKKDIRQIIATLDTYINGVYKCVDAFFSKRNTTPYQSHVSCFKIQLGYLRKELKQYPQPQTQRGLTLFNALHEIACALEKSQDMMCTTLGRHYSGTALFKAKALGDEMSKLTQPVNKLRVTIDKQIALLRNDFRTHAPDMLSQIDRLYVTINKTFDYGNKRGHVELGMILINRFKWYS